MSFDHKEFKKWWRRIPSPYTQTGRMWQEAEESVQEKLHVYYDDEPWRYYHTGRHIDSAIGALNEMGAVAPSTYIAIYFHDIIWLPGFTQNEERSADIAEAVLYRYGAERRFIEDVQRLIMATKHSGKPPADELEAQVRDADLWSLGERDEREFDSTQAAVRMEFAEVDEKLYNEARERLFQRMFLDRIYWSVPGQAREAQARENLARANIKLLGPYECNCLYHWLDSVHYEQIHGSDCVRGYC